MGLVNLLLVAEIVMGSVSLATKCAVSASRHLIS